MREVTIMNMTVPMANFGMERYGRQRRGVGPLALLDIRLVGGLWRGRWFFGLLDTDRILIGEFGSSCSARFFPQR